MSIGGALIVMQPAIYKQKQPQSMRLFLLYYSSITLKFLSKTSMCDSRLFSPSRDCNLQILGQ